jgi:hypothetical protein
MLTQSGPPRCIFFRRNLHSLRRPVKRDLRSIALLFSLLVFKSLTPPLSSAPPPSHPLHHFVSSPVLRSPSPFILSSAPPRPMPTLSSSCLPRQTSS